MSEGSFPPFRSGSFPVSVFRKAFARFLERRRKTSGGEKPEGEKPAPDPRLRSRAAALIQNYAETHDTLFERATRLRERADRLEEEGTPSESARNRAERAEGEIRTGLARLRSSFAASVEGGKGWLAFDREISTRYPAFKLPDSLY